MTDSHRDRFRASLRWTLCVAVVALLGACQADGVVCHRFAALPSAGWRATDTLRFVDSIPPSQAGYVLDVQVRHDARYPYQRLRIGVDTGADTLQLDLPVADDKGHWLGRGWGGLYIVAVQAGQLMPDSTGHCCLRVYPLMPDSLLKGVTDVGVRIACAPRQSAGR